MERVGGTRRIRVDVRVAGGDQQGPAGRDPAPAGSARTSTSGSTSMPIFVPPLRDRAGRHPAAGRSLHGAAGRASTAGGPSGSRPRRWPRLQQLRAGRATCASCATSIERLMIMVAGDTITAQDLAFLGDDGGQRRPPSDRPRRRGASAAGRGARAASSATTSCRRWPRSRATSRAPPMPSASSAAISTRR